MRREIPPWPKKGTNGHPGSTLYAGQEVESASFPPPAPVGGGHSPLALVHIATTMSWFFFPSKKPTPSEYAVIVVSSSVLFLVVGVIALVVAIRAPESKHESAVALAHLGVWCLGIGVAIALAYLLYRRLRD